MSSVQKVVLVPRFSTFAGHYKFRSAPVNVRDMAKADLTAWRSPVGLGQDVGFHLEESIDLIVWTTVADSTLAPLANAEETTSCDLEMPWIRSVVDVQDPGGDGCVVTCWLVGNFTMRDR